MHEHEERKRGAGDCLQPGDKTFPVPPATNDKPQPTDNLKCHAQKERELNDWLAIHNSRGPHEREVILNARKRQDVVCNVNEGKRTDECRRAPMEDSELHLKVANAADEPRGPPS